MPPVETEFPGVVQQQARDCNDQYENSCADPHVAMPHIKGAQLETAVSMVLA
jgi:hypothetical protein